ncbi:hypothetical protein STENM36S_02636 [Streptomyces tendae]
MTRAPDRLSAATRPSSRGPSRSRDRTTLARTVLSGPQVPPWAGSSASATEESATEEAAEEGPAAGEPVRKSTSVPEANARHRRDSAGVRSLISIREGL